MRRYFVQCFVWCLCLHGFYEKQKKTINELKNENEINLEEFNEYKELLEQKEQTGKIIADRDLFDSIFSNKVNL